MNQELVKNVLSAKIHGTEIFHNANENVSLCEDKL